MRRPAALTGFICAVAVVGLLVLAFAQRTRLAFTLGVVPAVPAATLQPGSEACQTPIAVPPGGDFDRVVVKLGTGNGAVVQVRDVGTKHVLGEGAVAAERADVGKITGNRSVDVCVLNHGQGALQVIGSGDIASRSTVGMVDGKPSGTDLTLRFERAPRSLLSLVPRMFDRAALFKTGWAGGWTFWLLAALVLLAVPALLVRAVSRPPE
jgi:hypothetical protein